MPPNICGFREDTGAIIPQDELINTLVGNAELSTLWRNARDIFGFHQNLVSLGISDEGVWNMLDYTWGALRTAILELS